MIGGMIAGHPIAGLDITGGTAASLAGVLAGTTAYLVEVDVQTGSGESDVVGGIGAFAIGGAPISGSTGTPGDASKDTLRFSDVGYITRPADQPANTLFESRAVNPGVIDRRISLSPESRVSGTQRVDFELANEDGSLDPAIANNAVEGQDVRVLVGNVDAAYADFVEVWKGQATGWDNDGKRVRIACRDSSYLMENPVQTSLYAGTGGVDGDADLTGTPKPLGFGKCVNVSPVLIDAANLIYQIHDGSIQSIDDVFDNGVALTLDADTTDLYTGSTTAGQYRSDISKGLFQLGSSPGVITVTFEGDDASGYVEKIPDIALRILQERASVNSTYIDADSFASLATAVSGKGNIYINDATSGGEVMDTLMRGVGAYWFTRRNGQFKVQRLAEPDPNASALDLDPINVLDLRRVQMPASIMPPHYRRTVGYNRNWTVQPGEGLAGAVTDARRKFLAVDWRTTVNTDVTVQTKHPLAQAPDLLQSNLDSKADADTLAAALMALHGPDRAMYEVELDSTGLAVEMGDTVKLTWPRFGLTNAGFFRAFPIRDDNQRRKTTLLLWG